MHRQLENAKRISHPQASFDIAAHILSLLPATDAPGIWETPQARTRRRTMSNRLRSALPIRVLRPRLRRLTALGHTTRRRLARLRFRMRGTQNSS